MVTSASHWRSVLAEVDQARLCSNPVRLHGIRLDRTTGELADGGLLVPCKDRRAAVCPSCSRLYRADAWQLVAAGIRGGKGVDASVVEHPQLFVTLTAPSFGPVHRASARMEPGSCRAGPGDVAARVRTAGRSRAAERHGADAARRRGAAVSRVLRLPGCGAVERARLASVGAHRRRLYREVARAAGIDDVKELRSLVRLSYMKVVEFQPVGSSTSTSCVRADGAAGPADPPPAWLDAGLLARPSKRPSPSSDVAVPEIDGTTLRSGELGHQSTTSACSSPPVRRRRHAPSPPTWRSTRRKRPTGRPGWPTRSARPPRSSASGSGPTWSPWCARPGRSGAAKDLAHLRLREHAHTLGYPGQFSSKSVRYSTTFNALRQARADFAEADGTMPATTSTTRRGGATPGGATRIRAPTSWPARSSTPARELPERARGFPNGFPKTFPRSSPGSELGEERQEKSRWGRFREPFEEPGEEPSVARWAP